MGLLDLHHVAIKTKNLVETVEFYVTILGMELAERPNFDFDGAWLKMNETMFHFYAGDVARNLNGEWHYDQRVSPIDHIALRAIGFDKMKKKIIESGYPWKQQDLSDSDIWQLFVIDPSGVKIEINFTKSKEPKGSKGPNNKFNRYIAGQF